MQEQVNVRINQAGEKSGIAEVNDLRIGWLGYFCADFFYYVAFDEDFAGGGDAAGFDVEQAGGVEDDGMRGWRGLRLRPRLRRLRLERRGEENRENEGENGAQLKHIWSHVMLAILNQFGLANYDL